jgi:hypothetical protein
MSPRPRASNPTHTAVAQRRLRLWPDAETRLEAASRFVAGEPLDDIVASYPNGPVTCKDDGSPASARRRRIYAEYAIKQEAVRAGFVQPLDPDDTGAIRKAYESDGMAWAECRTGLTGTRLHKRLKSWRPSY